MRILKKLALASLFSLLLINLSYSQEHYNAYDNLLKGYQSQNDNDYDSAIYYYEQISQVDTLSNLLAVDLEYCYIQLENYDKVIALCQEGVKEIGQYTEKHYYNYAIALVKKDQADKAIAILKEGLTVFPENPKLYSSIADVYYKSGQYEKAFRSIEETIKLFPTYSKAHVQYGEYCFNENKSAQALLCMLTGLIVEGDTKYGNSILYTVNKNISSKNTEDQKGVSISTDDDVFKEVDMLIQGYIALDKKYKTPSKLSLPVINQSYLLLTQLDELDLKDGFWSTFYLPFYKKVMSADQFKGLSYFVMQSSDNSSHEKIVLKNATSVASFKRWAKDYLTDKWLFRTIEEEGKKVKYNMITYNDGYPRYFGKVIDGSLSGMIRAYSPYGILTAKGMLSAADGKNGEWIYWKNDGSLSSKESYINGENEGPFISYHTNGNVNLDSEFQANKLHGKMKQYSMYGALRYTGGKKEGLNNGPCQTYYANGQVNTQYNLIDDEYDGAYVEYHDTGDTAVYYNYAEGEVVGDKLEYYRTGQLATSTGFIDGQKNGMITVRNIYGNTIKEYEYVNGKIVGKLTEYYPNGTLSRVENYDNNGLLEGESLKYDYSGRLTNKIIYKNNYGISYEAYEKTGAIKASGEKKKQSFYYEGFYSDGTRSMEGEYDYKGGRDGVWTYYNDYGLKSSVEEYKDGALEGNDSSFYANGQLKLVERYENGEENGKFEMYHPNGSTYKLGKSKDDKIEGLLREFNPDGTILYEAFYKNGRKIGRAINYAADGKKTSVLEYVNGSVTEELHYDTLGVVVDVVNYTDTTVTLIQLHYANGKIRKSFEMKNGNFHGAFKASYFNGTVFAEGQYFNDKKHGEWTYYHRNGKVSDVMNYYYGDLHGDYKEYFDNGQLDETMNYEYGDLHGLRVSYNENGTKSTSVNYIYGNKDGVYEFYEPSQEMLEMVRYYEYGKIIGYAYQGTDGTLEEMIPIENGTNKITTYYANGQMSRDYNIVGGEFDGAYMKYYPDGQVRSKDQNYMGLDKGAYLSYHPNGQIDLRSNLENDVYHGLYEKFYANGNKKKVINYVYGSAEGWGYYYNEEGVLTIKQYFYDGKVIYEEIY